MLRADHPHTRRALCAVVAERCLLHYGIATHRQNRNPHKPPAQPCRSPQCRPHHICCTMQRMHLALQRPMVCPGLATHALAAGLCALWLPSAASSSRTLHKAAKPQPPQTTCPALSQPSAQTLPHLLQTAEAAFNLAISRGMPGAGHSHTGRALCAVIAECCLLLEEISRNRQNHNPHKQLQPSPAAAPSAGPTTPADHCKGCVWPCSTP